MLTALGLATALALGKVPAASPQEIKPAPAFAQATANPGTTTIESSQPFVRPPGLPESVTLPKNLTLLFPPGPDVPPELARYYGVWTGLWGAADSVSVIHQMDSRTAYVVYCWGAVPGSYILTAGCTEGRLEFKGGELRAEGRRTGKYTFNPNGTLQSEATRVSREAGGIAKSEAKSLRKIYP